MAVAVSVGVFFYLAVLQYADILFIAKKIMQTVGAEVIAVFCTFSCSVQTADYFTVSLAGGIIGKNASDDLGLRFTDDQAATLTS